MENGTPAGTLRLIHIADLHFGAQADGALVALREALRALGPSLVVATGDLTQRGLPEQLRAARDFLDSIQAPWLAMPGNHDLPVMPWRRLIDPLRDYRRYLSAHTEPRLDGDLLRLAVLDSTDPTAWRAGRLEEAQVRAAADYLSAAAPGQIRIVATHHPFDELNEERRDGMRGAQKALEILCAEGQVDLLLCGHLHQTRIGILRNEGLRCVVGCVASTPTSPRKEAAGEAFVCVDLGEDAITLSPWRLTPDTERFRRVKARHFCRQRDNHWREIEPDLDDEDEA
ncbi:MAG: metallophosphoesterase [Rhodocyclaceae bacterium]|nr:metallophosphoesterase [Rhodocyclaceae bacterium]